MAASDRNVHALMIVRGSLSVSTVTRTEVNVYSLLGSSPLVARSNWMSSTDFVDVVELSEVDPSEVVVDGTFFVDDASVSVVDASDVVVAELELVAASSSPVASCLVNGLSK